MSPLLRDQIEVFFAPGRLNLVHLKRGLKPVQSPVLTEMIDDAQSGQPDWLQPMQQLEKMLSEYTGISMTVTLSNHFVRYVTLPPQAEITTPEEVLAYADFRMREIYGARVDHWSLSISIWSPIYGAICAAISQELLMKLEEVAKRHHSKLNGIEPYLTAVLDKWIKSLNRRKSYVALVETDRVCVALLENGIWHSIRNQRVLQDVADELLAALDQEAVLSGEKESVEQVFLFAPEHPALTLPDDSGWYMVPLQTETVTVPMHYPIPISDKTKENACSA
ncbi:hypothetical protein SAMN05216302_101514 [Nitrosomonas aestuarii]|uniref:Uncharacterized protein n=1 Tax=Nitrosomonas aestuarii TaxID=52441 RepID=A0A1I4CCN0_9PROT|nr:hypothetical protein [Nitrosomonas aestuarii]SFK77771.1 hypothetical protein SAMN05216302_101514 [Nitrosomonas aestuarii]